MLISLNILSFIELLIDRSPFYLDSMVEHRFNKVSSFIISSYSFGFLKYLARFYTTYLTIYNIYFDNFSFSPSYYSVPYFDTNYSYLQDFTISRYLVMEQVRLLFSYGQKRFLIKCKY